MIVIELYMLLCDMQEVEMIDRDVENGGFV